MRGSGAFACIVDGLFDVRIIEHRDRGQTHEGAVAGTAWIRRACKWFAGLLELVECVGGGIADIEAVSCAAHVPVPVPADIALHLIAGIEAFLLDQAFGQTKRHARVVGPLTWLQVKGSATDHIGNRRKVSALLELDGRAYGIANGQPQQASPDSVLWSDRHSQNMRNAWQPVEDLLGGRFDSILGLFLLVSVRILVEILYDLYVVPFAFGTVLRSMLLAYGYRRIPERYCFCGGLVGRIAR